MSGHGLSTSEINDDANPFLEGDQVIVEHDYAGWSGQTLLLDNATAYIAGWLVRKIYAILQCNKCRLCLVSDAVPQDLCTSYQLLRIKNNGGLVIPSPGMVRIVQFTEKFIQRLCNIHTVTNMCKFPRILAMVREHIGAADILLMGDHLIETQHGIDNHFTSLLYTIVEKYFNLRQHHIVKMYNVRKQAGTMRQKFNKLILFKGQ